MYDDDNKYRVHCNKDLGEMSTNKPANLCQFSWNNAHIVTDYLLRRKGTSGVMLSHRVLNSYWIAILYHSVVSRKFLVEEIYSSYNWTCLYLHSKLTGVNVSHCSNTIVYHEENRTQLLQQSTQIKVLKVLNAHVVHVTRNVTFSKTRR